MTVLYILSVCKAEEGSGVVPPLTDDNAADGKIGSAVAVVSGRMEHWGVFENCFPSAVRPTLWEIWSR